MDFEKKLIEARNEISDDIAKIKTEEDKKQFAEKYEFDSKEVDDVISKCKDWKKAIKASEGVRRSSANNMSGVDYSSDISYTESEVTRTNYKFMESIKKQSMKRIVSQISPEEITLELLDTLKEDKEDPNLSMMFQECFKKYATYIKPENVNEKFLSYLYENGYKDEITNPLISLAYKTFCDGKSKDEKIERLESKIEKQEELISFDEKVIKQLSKKIEILHQFTKKAKGTFVKLESKIGSIGTNIHKLGEKIEQEESKGIFKIIAQRIKSVFSKTPMLPASNDCNDIYIYSEDISHDARQSRFDMQSYDENQNWQEVRETVKQRQNMKKSINDPTPIEKKNGVIDFYFEKEDGWEIGEK